MDKDRLIGVEHKCYSKSITHLKDDLTEPFEAIWRKTDQLAYLMISETFFNLFFTCYARMTKIGSHS